MRDVVGGLSLFCIAVGLLQLSFLLFAGWSQTRLARRRATGVADAEADHPASPVVAMYALVPCLDEELVIGDTVRALLDQHPDLYVVVIDDASSDDTAAVAEAVDPERVVVCRRQLPDARLGKGPALNAGLAVIREAVSERGLDPAHVLVMVMDADGQLSPDAVPTVMRLFEDPLVGGAQLGVRIRNRSTNVLTTIQDCEFWGIAALGQMGRVGTNTVSLGGNGQFTRLQALEGLGRDPWSDALTEDLDLAVSLAVDGWHLTSTPDAWVSQQGLDRLRPLLRQRTRWFQGHMTTANRRLRDVWGSKHLSNIAVCEMTSYLLIPYLIVLPWSVLSQIGIVLAVMNLSDLRPTAAAGESQLGQIVGALVWYVISFAPALACGVVYSRREKCIGTVRAMLFSHLLVLWNYALFVACWRAVGRMVSGRTGWVKTARLVEPTDPAEPLSVRHDPTLAGRSTLGGQIGMARSEMVVTETTWVEGPSDYAPKYLLVKCAQRK